MHIVIVGVCAAGKSTLADNLKSVGYDAATVAQEHSYIPTLYRNSAPDAVVFLDASYAAIKKRRDVDWDEQYLAAEHERLAHVRAGCDLYLKTDNLNADQVYRRVRRWLEKREGARR